MAIMLYFTVKRAPMGNELMNKIAGQIQRGAKSFLAVRKTTNC